jgi:AraC family transcriptional regulator of adaptative response/methylated-DNA-[protein]-cysteine methyltransferase
MGGAEAAGTAIRDKILPRKRKNRVAGGGRRMYYHGMEAVMNNDYERIEQAIHYLEANYQRQPELSEIAGAVGLSEFHFQRLFTRWAGISPKRFLQYLTKEGAKQLLQRASVLEAAYGVGLSGPGRLHDLLVTTEAVTPGQVRAKGVGLEIDYGFHETPFGEALIGLTERGICYLGFVEKEWEAALEMLRGEWPYSRLRQAPGRTSRILDSVFGADSPSGPLPLFLNGTNFQIKVWEALLHIPAGSVTSYEAIAASIGNRAAVRAVGTAVARNPVAYLIPCHRVIRKVGEFGNYRYGTARKKALLGWEAAHYAME